MLSSESVKRCVEMIGFLIPAARAKYRRPTGNIQASPVFEPEARRERLAS